MVRGLRDQITVRVVHFILVKLDLGKRYPGRCGKYVMVRLDTRFVFGVCYPETGGHSTQLFTPSELFQGATAVSPSYRGFQQNI